MTNVSESAMKSGGGDDRKLYAGIWSPRRALISIALLMTSVIGVGFARPAYGSAHQSWGVATRPDRTDRPGSADSQGSAIASIAVNQEGTEDDPSNTYCNPFSGYWGDGTFVRVSGASPIAQSSGAPTSRRGCGRRRV